jgi:hypothetical protein
MGTVRRNRRDRRRVARIVPAAALALVAPAGCIPGLSSAAPATVICGKTLAHGDTAAEIVDATKPPPLRVVTRPTTGDLIIVRVSNCAHGDNLTIDPGDAARIVRTAPSKDGRTAAVVLRPVPAATFRIHGSGPNSFDLPVALATKRFFLPHVQPTTG